MFPDGTVNGRKARALVSLVSGANVAVKSFAMSFFLCTSHSSYPDSGASTGLLLFQGEIEGVLWSLPSNVSSTSVRIL